MSDPKASIVVPSRGGAERLPHLFDALGAQTVDDWEAIVVIDGDVDDSAAVVASVRDTLPVRSIVFPENRGRSAALNAGFAAAQGSILIRCDDDLRPQPDYVAGHVARHAGKSLGVIGLYRNVYPDTPFAHTYGRDRDRRFRDDAYAAGADTAWRYWAGNVSVTREVYDRVGDYDTRYRAYGWEDIDWGYRLHSSGIRVLLAPELETPHWIAAVTTEIRVRRAFHAGAARHRFLAKHELPAAVEGQASGMWNRLIHRTAVASDLPELLHRARRTDLSLRRMPKWLGEKVVSWLVESAALSGELRPDQVSNDV